MKAKILIIILFFSNYIFSQKNLKVGSQARKIFVSDWIMNTPKDKILKGKNIVLLFWDPTNTSQYIQNKKVDYIEKFNLFQEKFQQKDLYFISMADSDNVNAIKKYLKKGNFKTIAVIDKTRRTQRGFGNKDGSIFFPLVILIDKEGVIKCICDPYSFDEKYLSDFLNNTLVPFSMFDKSNN